MKYHCEIIKDLMPLYVDTVCSEQSKAIVEEHLDECENCKTLFQTMVSNDCIPQSAADNTDDCLLAENLKKVKKNIMLKRILTATFTIVIAASAALLAIHQLTTVDKMIEYENNITVSTEIPPQFESVKGQDYLSAQLTGRTWMGVYQKRVDIVADGEEQAYIYFQMMTSEWEDMFAKENVSSYHLLSPLNEDNDIDKVFYYTGDIAGIENKTIKELEEINNNAVLLWSK